MNATKEYGEVEEWLHSFLKSELDGGDWTVPWEQSPQYSLNKIWVCSIVGLGILGNRQISCFVPAIKNPIMLLVDKYLYWYRYIFYFN